MSGFACPKCGAITQILRSGGGKRISEDMHVPFLGSIPIDPQIAEACDSGQVFFEKYKSSATANSLNELIKPILALDKTRDSSSPLPYGIPGG
jgi:Flp pilus assembly CpaE family ATPase